MQLYSRTSVNVLVISVRTLVNLLVELTKLRLGGPWGGYPLYEPLPDCIPPQRPMDISLRPTVCRPSMRPVRPVETYETYETYGGKFTSNVSKHTGKFTGKTD